MDRSFRRRLLAQGAGAALLLVSLPAVSATYLPLCDADLADRSPVIVVVRVLDREIRLETSGASPLPVTVVRLSALDLLKGDLPSAEIRLVLPGGEKDGLAVWLPGTPTLTDGQNAVLFLAPHPGRPGEYRLTEFGLSVFDVMEDPDGTRFAVRALFASGEERFLSGDETAEPTPDAQRDYGAFVAALRAAAAGVSMAAVSRGTPAGPLRLAGTDRTANWVNIGGPEGGTGNLFRWFWDTSGSPDAIVVPQGTQSNLTDGTNGLAHVQNTATKWHGVANATVNVSYGLAATSGVVRVNLDVDSYTNPGGGIVWSAPLGCGGGVLGSGGPSAVGTFPFKGSTYWAIQSGAVWMRKSTCGTGYDAATFRSAVLHEVGHTMGLGHPDLAHSPYSVTSQADWDAAVMRSAIPAARPDTPQVDDAAGIRYYYGISGPGGGGTSAPVASFTYSPATPYAGEPAQFTDTSTGPPTTWAWSFGDGTLSTAQNPQKTYAAPGIYSVQLTVSNFLGYSSTSRSVSVVRRALPPVASFTWSPSAPKPGQNITFTDTSTNVPTSWLWSFGDGTSSPAQNPLKAFAAVGSYTVRLTATNVDGSGTMQQTVVVATGLPAPIASDSSYATPQNTMLVVPAPGVLSSVTNPSGDILIAALVSTTSNGTLSLNLNGSFVYVPNGGFSGLDSFTFKAHETTGGRDSNVATVRISVSAVTPVAAFTYTPALPRAGEPVQFNDASTGIPNAWAWDFGDSSTSTLQSPMKTYAQPGTYAVTLTVTNAGGSSTVTRQVVVTSLAAPPTVVDATFSTVLNTPLDVPAPGVLGGAMNPAGGPLVAVLAADVSAGALTLNTDGSFRYAPARDYTGTDTFRFLARDPATGLSSNAATVTLRVLDAVDTGVVPIVLEAAGRGGAYFTTELTVVNRGTRRASVKTDFISSTALTGSDAGSGTVRDQLASGHQVVYRNAISYLRTAGVPIGPAAPQGGSVRLTLSGLSAPDVTFALARTTSASGNGRAGLAYSAVSLRKPLPSAVHLFGLRETDAERTNLALLNAGTNGPVTLRVTLVPGDGGAPALVGDYRLDPGQWQQLNSVLNLAHFTSGWARVERVDGTEPFSAYAVFNDNLTNDGAFVPAIPTDRAAEVQLLPVLVENAGFTSELVLANPADAAMTAELVYVESSALPPGPAGSVFVTLPPRTQQILPNAIDFLRTGGAAIGPSGVAYAGAVSVRFRTGDGAPAAGFAGARTSSPASGGGLYGLSYAAAGTSELATSEAWVYGLQQTERTRSNLALVNAGADSITLHVDVFDGDAGTGAGSADYDVPPGGWFQASSFLRRFVLENAYVRITRTDGTGPFLAYGVLNDGANFGEGTSDGSYVPMVVVK